MFQQRAAFNASIILLFTSFLLNTTSAMTLNTSSAMLNASLFPDTTSVMTFNTSSAMLNASSLMFNPSSLYVQESALAASVNGNMSKLLLRGAVSNVTGHVKGNMTSGKDPTKVHKDRMYDVYFFVMGCVIPCGLCCNIFCVVIFSLSATLRRTTTGHYLTALACADALFLVGDMIRWANSEGKDGYYLQFDLMHTSNVLCKASYWLRYGAKLVSAWVIVAIAVERLVTVAAPLKVSRLSTSSRARIAIVLLYVVGFGLMAFPLWTVGVQLSKKKKDAFKCIVTDKIYYPLNMVFLNFGSLIVPAFLILVITILIVTILVRASHRRLEQMEGQNPLTKHSAGGGVRSLRQNTEHQLTAMLIAVCVAFLSFRLPYAISYYMYESLKVGKEDPWTKLYLFVVMKSADILATFNYVANFFLYCLCGSYFRQQVLATIRCHRKSGGSRFVRHVGNDGSLMAFSSSRSRASTSTRASFISVNFIRMSTVKRNSGLVEAVGNNEDLVKPVNKARTPCLKNVLQGN